MRKRCRRGESGCIDGSRFLEQSADREAAIVIVKIETQNRSLTASKENGVRQPGRLTVQDSERERVSGKLHRDKNRCGFGCDVRQRHDELTQANTDDCALTHHFVVSRNQRLNCPESRPARFSLESNS